MALEGGTSWLAVSGNNPEKRPHISAFWFKSVTTDCSIFSVEWLSGLGSIGYDQEQAVTFTVHS